MKLKTPRAAAIAGILFALLYGAGLVLIRLSVPADQAADSAWLDTNSRTLALALNLAPYAGIAFLWFIGVIRDRLGDLEDRFFATVFLGSIWLRTGLMQRGWAFLTYTLALVLLLSVSFSAWAPLIFPSWVLAVSVYFLIPNLREQRQDALNEI
jgi:hypothetical protein